MKSNTQLRQENIKKVLSAVRVGGPLSKRELQTRTGLSWGNISSVTSLLLSEGYVMTSGKQETHVGRKPEELDINVDDHYIIGIDFNSQGISAVLCDLKGRVVSRQETAFEKAEKDTALDALYTLIDVVLNAYSGKTVSCIALAMQGKVDTLSGVSVRISAIKGWENVPVCQLLKDRFDIDVVMLHDPDCLLYTERYFGLLHGRQIDNAVLLRIDHGVGIAMMLGGTMYMGTKGKTCEIGTTVVPFPDTPAGVLLKDVLREDAVSRHYADASLSCEAIALLAKSGDAQAAHLFSDIGKALGTALNNAASLLNPEMIILFGDFTKYAELFLPTAQQTLIDYMGPFAPETALSRLSGDAAAIGAALFAADTVIEQLQLD